MVPAPPRPCAKPTPRSTHNTTANTAIVRVHRRHKNVCCIQSSAACASHGDTHRTRLVSGNERYSEASGGARDERTRRVAPDAVRESTWRYGTEWTAKHDASAASSDTRAEQS